MSRPNPTQLARVVDDFNARAPIGTRVRYWTGARRGPGAIGETRSPAQLLGDHTPVVWITGARGGIALSHVVIEPEPEHAGDVFHAAACHVLEIDPGRGSAQRVAQALEIFPPAYSRGRRRANLVTLAEWAGRLGLTTQIDPRGAVTFLHPMPF